VDQFENDFLQSIGQKFCHNFENTIEEWDWSKIHRQLMGVNFWSQIYIW
jgi:hypothetical protein